MYRPSSLPVIIRPLLLLLALTSVGVRADSPTSLTPVILFPAFHLSKLVVTVRKQKIAPDCPDSGKFEDWYQNDTDDGGFSQVCRDRLLSLHVNTKANLPWPSRFTDPKGVTVTLKDYGTVQSAPYYEPMYGFLEAHGYVRNRNIRIAGYDSRLTPDLGGFLVRTKALIEETYEQNGRTPVHLVGHSNGPIYAHYLLTHTTKAWKRRYIHGFTPIAGNFPGQGLLYPVFFSGLNVQDFGFPATADNAASSAAMYQTHPSSYISASNPVVFGRREIVIETLQPARSYTPEDFPRLFRDARLPVAQFLANRYIGFLKFIQPKDFPGVDVYGERGSGLQTLVGARLDNLRSGQVLDPARTVFFNRDGDSNQEDITNTAISVWGKMRCYHFELNDNKGIGHFDLPGHPDVLQRLVRNLKRSRSQCA